jgi:hypothetical protein
MTKQQINWNSPHVVQRREHAIKAIEKLTGMKATNVTAEYESRTDPFARYSFDLKHKDFHAFAVNMSTDDGVNYRVGSVTHTGASQLMKFKIPVKSHFHSDV